MNNSFIEVFSSELLDLLYYLIGMQVGSSDTVVEKLSWGSVK